MRDDEGDGAFAGEPHPRNVLRTDDGLRTIDWDTALIAPRERDLWMLLPDTDADSLALQGYVQADQRWPKWAADSVGSSTPDAGCHILNPGGAVGDMDLVRHGRAEPAAVLAAPGVVAGAAAGRDERKQRVAVSGSARGAVRADMEEIFRRDYQRVVGVAARVLGSRNQAEDVAQDVFLSFGRSSVPAGEARGWLCVAAVHTALNLLRSGRRRAWREETAAAAEDAVVSDVAEAVVTLEERSNVRAALARLPRKHALVLVLRHSGLSYADVAAALDLSPGSVGTTVRRAESALRKELNRHASSD